MPVGVVPPDGGVTFEAKVTLCPVLMADADAVSEVLVAISLWATMMVTGDETDAELLVLPP
jgi:hypothetical protein